MGGKTEFRGMKISGGKSSQLSYLSKILNTAMSKFSATSKSQIFKIDLSKTKVLVSIKMYLKVQR